MFLLFLGLGLVWRVARYAMGPPIWGDEAFLAVNLLTRDFAGLLEPLDYYQIAPAGFLWVERLIFRLFGASEWSLRLIPFVSGLLALGLFSRFASKTVDRRSALFAVGIFAASFYPVRHATEIKPYATDLLAGLITLILAWKLWLDRVSVRKWLIFTVWVSAAVWFSYPMVFVAAGMGSVLGFGVIRQPERRAVVAFVVFGFVSASSFLLSYFLVARPQANAAPFYSELETWRGAFPPFEKPWLIPYWLVDVHTGNMLAYPNGGRNFASLLTTILVVTGSWTLRRNRPAFLAMLLSPLAPTFVASCLQRYPYGTSARTTLYMAPCFCLLAGVGLVSLIRRFHGARRLRLYSLSVVALGSMIVISTIVNMGWPYKNYEDGLNRRGIETLAELSRPDDVWLFYDGVETLPLTKGLMLEHWLQQMAEVRYNVLAKAPVSVQWKPEPSKLEPSLRGHTWLIVHRSRTPAFNEARLAELLSSLQHRLGTPTFHVDHLTRGESIEAFEFSAPAQTGFVR